MKTAVPKITSQSVSTLLFLRREGEVLLAMKKRGFGAGRWNGIGGKVEPGETIEAALVRECQEEIGVTPRKFYKVALHDFRFTNSNNSLVVYTFECTDWEGEPIETEEMAPKWFRLSAIPYDDMWQDDRYWLPQTLSGKKLHTCFTFDDHDNLLDSEIHEAAMPE